MPDGLLSPEQLKLLRSVHPRGHSFERTAREVAECVICGLLNLLDERLWEEYPVV